MRMIGVVALEYRKHFAKRLYEQQTRLRSESLRYRVNGIVVYTIIRPNLNDG